MCKLVSDRLIDTSNDISARVQGFPVEDALSERALRRTSWSHLVGDPANTDLLKQAGIGNAQVLLCSHSLMPAVLLGAAQHVFTHPH